MSTSSPGTLQVSPPRKRGFSALELLIGLSLTVCLALTVCPAWSHMERVAADRADMSVALVQSRVAIARLEKDLRIASAGGCLFTAYGPILEASPHQVVLLASSVAGSAPLLVEWELKDGALMRRRGPCPAVWPTSFSHSLYVDNKTMLEHVAAGGAFSFLVDGVLVAGSLSREGLDSVEAVVLSARVRLGGAPGTVAVDTRAWVGR